ncbi:restriction endonuclease [Halocatena halophila]|uniref:restriction endonuclease n=1 Tax=Halocatena halophila TaxID=2814576 RepID=UPI002ECFFD17
MVSDNSYFSSLLISNSSRSSYNWDVQELRNLTAEELERVVGALYAADGFTVEAAGPQSESGIDLLCEKRGFFRSKLFVVSIVPPGGTVTTASIESIERARSINGAKRAVLVRPEAFEETVASKAAAYDALELVDADRLTCRLSRHDVFPP